MAATLEQFFELALKQIFLYSLIQPDSRVQYRVLFCAIISGN